MDTHTIKQHTGEQQDRQQDQRGVGALSSVIRGSAGRNLGRPDVASVLVVYAAAAAICYAANRIGWWWITPLVGFAAGLCGLWWRRGTLVAFCVVVPLLAWGGDLFLQWTSADLTRVAKVTVGVADLGNDDAWLGYVLTLTYAVLLCTAGVWLGASVRQVVRVLRAPSHAEAVSAESPAGPVRSDAVRSDAVRSADAVSAPIQDRSSDEPMKAKKPTEEEVSSDV